MIPVETLNMLGVASSAASSSASVVQLKMEGAERGKTLMVTSESAPAVAGVESSSTSSGAPASIPLMPIQPQFIVPLQSAGPSTDPIVIETDEASEPKRLRIADEGWTSDS